MPWWGWLLASLGAALLLMLVLGCVVCCTAKWYVERKAKLIKPGTTADDRRALAHLDMTDRPDIPSAATPPALATPTNPPTANTQPPSRSRRPPNRNETTVPIVFPSSHSSHSPLPKAAGPTRTPIASPPSRSPNNSIRTDYTTSTTPSRSP